MAVSIVKIQSAANCKSLGYTLTPKQALALPLVLAGKAGKDIAEEVGVMPSTVSDWINHNTEFKKALAAERDAALDRARKILEAGAVDAAHTLVDTTKGGKGSANKTKAAITVLDKAGVIGPGEGYPDSVGIDPQTQALVALIQQRRAKKELEEANHEETDTA